MLLCADADAQAMTPPQLQLEFKCFLIDHKTNKHVPVNMSFIAHRRSIAERGGCFR